MIRSSSPSLSLCNSDTFIVPKKLLLVLLSLAHVRFIDKNALLTFSYPHRVNPLLQFRVK